jgi:hypothetical protein
VGEVFGGVGVVGVGEIVGPAGGVFGAGVAVRQKDFSCDDAGDGEGSVEAADADDGVAVGRLVGGFGWDTVDGPCPGKVRAPPGMAVPGRER